MLLAVPKTANGSWFIFVLVHYHANFLSQLNYCMKHKREVAARDGRAKLVDSAEQDIKAGDLTLPGGAVREGAREQVANFCMLNSGLPVWAPEVQEYGVMTEDMVAEQLELLTRLGSDTAGAGASWEFLFIRRIALPIFSSSSPFCHPS